MYHTIKNEYELYKVSQRDIKMEIVVYEYKFCGATFPYIKLGNLHDALPGRFIVSCVSNVPMDIRNIVSFQNEIIGTMPIRSCIYIVRRNIEYSMKNRQGEKSYHDMILSVAKNYVDTFLIPGALDEIHQRYAALKIQRVWRSILANPYHLFGTNRLQREFEEMSELIMRSATYVKV